MSEQRLPGHDGSRWAPALATLLAALLAGLLALMLLAPPARAAEPAAGAAGEIVSLCRVEIGRQQVVAAEPKAPK